MDGTAAPWHPGGIFNIGNCSSQLPIAIEITTGDEGTAFSGTMTYSLLHHVENQWGGSTAPWHDAGFFLLGARNGQNLVAAQLKSTDGGKSLTGTITYAGEKPIGCQCALAEGYTFNATNQWSGTQAPLHPGGQLVLGCRANQAVINLDVASNDGGKTLTGLMTYAGEGPIGFRATLTTANTYTVENQWGGPTALWNPGGQFVIGCRGTQGVVAVKVSAQSASDTKLSGTMTYAGEGPIQLNLVRSVDASVTAAV